jgi:hypothetical protein
VELLQDDDPLVISMTRRELLLLTSCVGEAIEAVEDWEFQTRLGQDKDAARSLRAALVRVTEGTSAPAEGQ